MAHQEAANGSLEAVLAAFGEPEGHQERFLKHKGMSHVSDHLEGKELMDMYDEMKADDCTGEIEGGAWQAFCDRVCKEFFNQSKDFKKPLLSLVDLPRVDHPLFLRAVGPHYSSRPETCNWKRARQGNQLTSEANVTAARKDELTSRLTLHLGEARTWNCPKDSWVEVPREEATEWKNRIQVAASGAESDILFSPFHQSREERLASGSSPDLANPLSTLVCPHVNDPETVCLRSVKAVTLAAVLHHYKEDFMLEDLYKAWCAGRLVVRARSGTASISPPHIPSPPSSLCFEVILASL